MRIWKKFHNHRKLRQAVFKHFSISLWALQNTGCLRIQISSYTYICTWTRKVTIFLVRNGLSRVAVLCEILHLSVKPSFLCFGRLKCLNFPHVNVSCFLLEMIPFKIWKTKWGYLVVRLPNATSAEQKKRNSVAPSWSWISIASDRNIIVILGSCVEHCNLNACQTAFWTSPYLHLYVAEKSKTA